MICIAGSTIYATKVSIARYLKWLLIPLPFLFLSFLTILLTGGKTPESLLWSIRLMDMYIGINSHSIEVAFQLFFRSFGCLMCTYFYALTVPFQQILQVLKACHLPDVLIEITMLMYRFIFILLEEVTTVHQAQVMRFGHYGLRNTYHSLGLLLRLVFVQTFARYQQMATALEMKGFQGEFPL